MIIDVHAHVSAPPELYAYQANMLASRAPAKRILKIEDEKVQQGLKSHLKFLEEARTDMQLLSPRPYTQMHHEQPWGIVNSYIQACNNLIAQQVAMYPDKFKGVAGIPQSPGRPVKECLPELERCVKELGFVGLLINPDPGARGDDSTPGMGDEYWYPLYEKMCELDVPGMIHSSTCLSSRLNYQSRRDMARKAVSPDQYFENVAKKIFYDTCIYTPEGLELLFKVIGPANCCFGTEAPGAGSSVNPHTGKAMDDLRPIIEGFGWLSDSDKKAIFEMNARKLYKI
jgi:predicted TIM-barrel fold metal-dependent hydrolase